MADIPVQDRRGFFILPQHFEGGGYYVYGTPAQGRGQYAHPRMISLIQAIACDWCHLDSRKFGIGNISLANDIRFKPMNHIAMACRSMCGRYAKMAVRFPAAG